MPVFCFQDFRDLSKPFVCLVPSRVRKDKITSPPCMSNVRGLSRSRASKSHSISMASESISGSCSGSRSYFLANLSKPASMRSTYLECQVCLGWREVPPGWITDDGQHRRVEDATVWATPVHQLVVVLDRGLLKRAPQWRLEHSRILVCQSSK